jgi:hypothetical protein
MEFNRKGRIKSMTAFGRRGEVISGKTLVEWIWHSLPA